MWLCAHCRVMRPDYLAKEISLLLDCLCAVVGSKRTEAFCILPHKNLKSVPLFRWIVLHFLTLRWSKWLWIWGFHGLKHPFLIQSLIKGFANYIPSISHPKYNRTFVLPNISCKEKIIKKPILNTLCLTKVIQPTSFGEGTPVRWAC